MLKGAKPAGIPEPGNPPETVASCQALSNTSIVPAFKFAAYSSGPEAVTPDASPLYTAPEDHLATITFALPASTAGSQPEIVPDSVANRNRAGFPDAISNAGVPLKTCAVGAPVGILTTMALAPGNGWPRPLYK